MKNKLFALCLVAILSVSLLGISSPMGLASGNVVKSVQSLSMFNEKFDAHYRVPNIEQIENLLEEKGIPLNTPEMRSMAVQTFRQEWAERNPTTPNPKKLRELMEKEREGALGRMASAEAAAEPQFMSLAVPVEFPTASETFNDGCGNPVTFAGPQHNQIPAPGPRDNNTIWYEDVTPELYNELYFGVGPDAGVVVNHPNLGLVDLRGSTMANYYLEQSEGKFLPKGLIYPKWLQASHSEAWYGADNCSGSNHNVLAGDLVREVVDAVNADDPDFAWQDFDGDGDGVVDNFTVIHAGAGQESGGGVQGDFAIWSHASAIDFPSGKLACTAGSPGCPDRNIYVREYSMDPENIDVGVISEEYGHAAFGLPDIYTTDYQASPSNWAIMEAGSWNGPLGGMQPAPFPLYFRYLVGWSSPVELDYTTGPVTLRVGQHSLRPYGTEQGIKINLPDQVIDIPNRAGTGQGWWSDRADLADFYLAHDFDLTGTTAPVFSFNSYWSFEADYDYGYFEVSEDGGAIWTALPDMDGFMVDNGSGTMGLNGEDQGNLRFDLAAYAGKQVTLRLHYTSDVGVQWAGWWADDFSLDDGANNLFSDDVEAGMGDWATNNFVFVPLTRIHPMYYLAEWRNNSGFDRGLAYPYSTVYSNDTTNEWEVDRSPYTVPGMLLWLRNGAYDFDYVLSDSWYDSPSYGPKHALLLIDSHYWPLTWSGSQYLTGAYRRIGARSQPANAAFTLQETTPFTLRRVDSIATGNVLETKTFAPQAPVSQFHDSLGYYPGFYWTPVDPAYVYWWNVEASAVIPAQGDYSTKITYLDQTPLYDFYGDGLGSGNPGDEGVQYGLHLAVVSKASNGSWGLIKVWNSPTLLDLTKTVSASRARPGQVLGYTIKIVNTSPVPQSFKLVDPLPEHTTFLQNGFYDPATNSIQWNGTVGAYGTKQIKVYVRVNADTPKGTVITNTAYLADGAVGDTASATTDIR